MKLIDTHCHLENRTYGDEMADVIARAVEAGVDTLVTIGSSDSLDICREAIALADAYPQVWATVGYHPHYADKVSAEALKVVEELAGHDRVVAVGEIGLDYHYDRSPRDVQRQVFRDFIEVARRVDKPIVIHNRDSDADCMEIMKSSRAGEVGGVVHCFTSSWELAKFSLDEGFFLGFTGIVSFKNAEEIRDMLRKTPRDRIVVETDSPYLTPTPYRGKRNEPAYVVHVAEAVAAALDMSVAEVCELTNENAKRLYRLP